MKDKPNVRESLDRALMDITNAQNLLTTSLKTVEKSENKEILQDTYNCVTEALETVRTADYKAKS